MGETTLWQLPNHIIVEIFCKVPIKALAQCRCVCRSWRRWLSNPQFTKHLFSRTPTWVLLGPDATSSGGGFLVDLNKASASASPNNVALLMLSENIEHIVGSCNGFLCHYDRTTFCFYIFNPITGESLALPKLPDKGIESSISKEYPCFYCFGFGFSPISLVFKVVLFITPNKKGCAPSPRRIVMVLTVGSGTWRSIGDSDFNADFFESPPIYFNGFLHWVGRCEKGSFSRLIYAFDVETELLQQLPPPPWTLDSPKPQVGVLKGCLSITARLGTNISVWVMKDYGVKESWTKELEIRDVTCSLCPFLNVTQVLKSTEEARVFFLVDNNLQAYNLEKRDFERVEFEGIPSFLNGACTHIPSFVSLQDVIRG